jgi:hypothetical protein
MLGAGGAQRQKLTTLALFARHTEDCRRLNKLLDAGSDNFRPRLPVLPPGSSTPNSDDFFPASASISPALANPTLNSSRTAAARLGMRCLKRKSSTAASSSGDSMICNRSPRVRFSFSLVIADSIEQWLPCNNRVIFTMNSKVSQLLIYLN